MARFNFRQGMARRQEDGLGNPAFLQKTNGGAYIDLIVAPDPTVFLIAHFDENYMFTENVTVPRAWGPFSSGINYWLYWDVDFITGEISRNFTLLQPVDQPFAPASPQADQHWFDTVNNVMKVWNGATWVEYLRLFAAEYNNGATIVPQPLGSQIGVTNTVAYAGEVLFDPDNKPLQQFRRDRRGKFIHSETPLVAQFSRNANFRVEAAIIQAKAEENIDIHHCVGYSGPNIIKLARNTVPDIPAIGIAAEPMVTNETRSFITKGYVQNDVDWDWSAYPAGTPLFCGSTGQLVTTPPVDFSLQQIATIVDPVTIFVNVRPLIRRSGLGNLVNLTVDRDTGQFVTRESVTDVPPGFFRSLGFCHVQTVADTVWTITHNGDTEKLVAQIYNETNEWILPDRIEILSVNTVLVHFGFPQTGKAFLALFVIT